MHLPLRGLALLLVALPLTALAQSPEAARLTEAAPFEAATFEAATFEAALPFALDYALALPEGYEDDPEATWPLVLFLHGSGERGDDLHLVAVHGPLKEIRGGVAFPFVLVAPQLPAERPYWDARELGALLDHIEATLRIDATQIYVTGLSMGGYGTWDLVLHHPDRFAAAVPICGGSFPFRARTLAGTPIWVFHGALDTVVPLERSAEMARAIQAVGGDVKLTVYPEAGHDSWSDTYANPAVYEWLLSHRRGDEDTGNEE
ncbi:MAG: prolyl oligopeptidase family serine peptidase [Bacteroidota bacterium]